MHTANLELCKELYKLSGWDKAFFCYDTNPIGTSLFATPFTIGIEMSGNYIPAYDLGYLWRKFEELGNDLNVGFHDSSCNMTFAFGQRGTGTLLDGFGTRIDVEPEDTIEDYFCQFFIKLFNQKVLLK